MYMEQSLIVQWAMQKSSTFSVFELYWTEPSLVLLLEMLS